jgi:hypothetical protein
MTGFNKEFKLAFQQTVLEFREMEEGTVLTHEQVEAIKWIIRQVNRLKTDQKNLTLIPYEHISLSSAVPHKYSFLHKKGLLSKSKQDYSLILGGKEEKQIRSMINLPTFEFRFERSVYVLPKTKAHIRWFAKKIGIKTLELHDRSILSQSVDKLSI